MDPHAREAELGRNTVACNLSARARKIEPRRVLLMDMDPLLGSVAFLLRLRTPFSVVDAITGAPHMDCDMWKKLTVEHGGVDILTAPEKPQPDEFECGAVAPLLHFCRETYGITLIDSPGPVSPWQLQLAAESDQLILVTTNELAAIHATQRALQRIENAGIARPKIRLIVNRYMPEKGLSVEAIETGLKIPVFHLCRMTTKAYRRPYWELEPFRPLPGSHALSTNCANGSPDSLRRRRRAGFSKFCGRKINGPSKVHRHSCRYYCCPSQIRTETEKDTQT